MIALLLSFALFVSAAVAEDLPPTSEVSVDNYETPLLADIDEDPNAPDGDDTVLIDDTADADLCVGFDTPTSAPSGDQVFEALVARSASGGKSASFDVELWEDGSRLETLVANITLSVAQVFVFPSWDPSQLSDSSGAGVELCIFVDASSGKPSDRRSGVVRAARWVAQ